MKETITIETVVKASIEKAWEEFTNPSSVKKWNSASPDWHTPRAENDLQTGGRFSYRMESKDGNEGFDFSGTYTSVAKHSEIAYKMEDGRKVKTSFTPEEDGVRITTTFEPESENSHEMQRAGWQAILDNFRRFAENKE